jgi:DNA replication protein DnaC
MGEESKSTKCPFLIEGDIPKCKVKRETGGQEHEYLPLLVGDVSKCTELFEKCPAYRANKKICLYCGTTFLKDEASRITIGDAEYIVCPGCGRLWARVTKYARARELMFNESASEILKTEVRQSALDLGLTEAEKLHFSVLQMPLRAEEIPYEQLLQLSKSIPFGLKRVVTMLTDFLVFNNFNNRRFFLGLKGSGKTLAALVATLVASEKCGLRVAYFLFKKDSKEIVTFPSLQKVEIQSLSKIFSKPFDAIILDDIHYMCEYAIEESSFCHQLITFLSEVLKFAEQNKKKVLLISEEPLLFYAEKINDAGMDRVCHSFGQYAKFCDTHKEIDWSAFSEMPYLDFDGFCRFLAWCNIEVDTLTSILLYRIARLPRRLLIVLRKMNMNKFSLNEVTSKAIEELTLNRNQYYVDLLQKLPIEKGPNIEYRFSFTREIREAVKQDPTVEETLKHFSEELLAVDSHLKLKPRRRNINLQIFNTNYNKYYQIISRAFEKYGYFGILHRIRSSSTLSKLHSLGLLIDSGIKAEKTVWDTTVWETQGKQPIEYTGGVLVTPFLKAFFGED